jgi:hypothetical protein
MFWIVLPVTVALRFAVATTVVFQVWFVLFEFDHVCAVAAPVAALPVADAFWLELLFWLLLLRLSLLLLLSLRLLLSVDELVDMEAELYSLACGLPSPLWVEVAVAVCVLSRWTSFTVFVGFAYADDIEPNARATAEAIKVLRIEDLPGRVERARARGRESRPCARASTASRVPRRACGESRGN